MFDTELPGATDGKMYTIICRQSFYRTIYYKVVVFIVLESIT